jgi:Zn-dependent peptidase ImmA (M78 family)
MTLTEMYAVADAEGIGVFDFHLNGLKAISAPLAGDAFIAIDTNQISTVAEEKEQLSHELGHCLYGGFYNAHSKYDVRAKHELLADRWAIKKLIPKDELNEAVSCGYTELWELAEYFGVSEQLISKAIECYQKGWAV